MDTQNRVKKNKTRGSGLIGIDFQSILTLNPFLKRYTRAASSADIVVVGAHALIQSKGQLLVIKEGRHQFYNLPGGSFEAADSYLFNTLKRELSEETNGAIIAEETEMPTLTTATLSRVDGKVVLYIAVIYTGVKVTGIGFPFPIAWINSTLSDQAIHPMVYRCWTEYLLLQTMQVTPDAKQEHFFFDPLFNNAPSAGVQALSNAIRHPVRDRSGPSKVVSEGSSSRDTRANMFIQQTQNLQEGQTTPNTTKPIVKEPILFGSKVLKGKRVKRVQHAEEHDPVKLQTKGEANNNITEDYTLSTESIYNSKGELILDTASVSTSMKQNSEHDLAAQRDKADVLEE